MAGSAKPQVRPEVIDHLAAIVTRRREQAGITGSAVARAAGRNRSAITRFETDENYVPQDLDAVIAAYAELTGADPVALWRQAVDVWEHQQ